MLNLDANRLGNPGACAFGAALRVNSTLKSLNLWKNNIGAPGAKAVADSLASNTSITALNLWQNHIDADGAAALAEALEFNRNMASRIMSNKASSASDPKKNETKYEMAMNSFRGGLRGRNAMATSTDASTKVRRHTDTVQSF